MATAPAPHGDGRDLLYSDVRDQIRTGDILLFQGTSLLSRVIRWGSRSVYSHAGFAAWWDRRLLVFQASGRGAEVLPVSSAVDAYDGQVDWYSLRPEHRLPKEAEDQLITHAVTLLGRSYSGVGLVHLMWRMALGRFRGRADPKACPDSLFCSQYVSYCFRMVGPDLVLDTDDGSTSPADLSNSPLLERRGVLHADPFAKAARRAGPIPGKPRGQTAK